MIATTTRRNPLLAASNQSERGSPEWPDMKDSLETIVAACQRADHSAQRELYERCNVRVYRLAVRMVGVQEASDLTQQIFLRLFHTIHQFSGRSGFETWRYRLAVNECLQFLRHAKRHRHASLEYDPATRAAEVGRELRARELLELALERLEPDLRAVYLLREIEGLGYEELAIALEISAGTVASRLNRARFKLKEHLLELGWEI